MKKKNTEINIVIHKPTGAKVPVVILEVNKENIITKYAEYTEKRKGFTLLMLTNRWDKCVEEVIEILQHFQVPVHLRHSEAKMLQLHEILASKALFFEEYIYGIEKKTKITHKKLKSKSIISLTEH